MPIITSDILTKFATTAGSAGNSTAQADPAASLGKYISTSTWSGGTLHDLFDAVTGDENAASRVDYRCLFIHNNHATLTYEGVVVYISAEVAGGCNVALGVDTTAASAIGSSSAQALTISSETTAPSGVSFSTPTTKATGLSLGNIGPGQCKAIWVRRTATNSVAVNNDGFTLAIAGDTQA